VLLGVHPKTVVRMIRRGELAASPNWASVGLLRSDVERLSLTRWRPGDRAWLTVTQVAEQLDIPAPGVYQLSNDGRLPSEKAPGGRRLYRPDQIAVIARVWRERSAPSVP